MDETQSRCLIDADRADWQSRFLRPMCKKRLTERPFGKVNGKEVEGRSGNTKLKANKVGATGWWLLVRNIKPWEVTEAFINDWNQDAAKQMVPESIANQ